MEFNFNINNFFKDEITKVGSRLIPDGFVGDRREVQDCLSKVSYVLTVLGERSAKAQGLLKVITSGEKLRNSDHVVYILKDPEGGSKGYGTILGMLKMGVKHLYVFDAGGNNHEVTTKCVLDFYVHESKQRMGLGKKLFQFMLKEERVDPVHLAIDKPSSKFLSFLVKHYGLQKIIPQMNNFVVFEGFFSNRQFGGGSDDKEKLLPAGVSSCGNRYSSGSAGYSPTSPATPHPYQSPSTINVNHSYYGRPAAHKPVSTMGMILQQKPAPSQQPAQNGSKSDNNHENSTSNLDADEGNKADVEESPPEPEADKVEETISVPEAPAPEEETGEMKEADENEKETDIQMASPDSLESPPDVSNNNNNNKNQNNKNRLNSQGHLDLKFYHSSLW